MSLKNLGDVSYFRLNNEINRPVNGQIPLNKDKEALRAFFRENVIPNSMAFDTIIDKINYLIDNDYIESEFISKYTPDFIESLAKDGIPIHPDTLAAYNEVSLEIISNKEGW